jgi:hypothetical protein
MTLVYGNTYPVKDRLKALGGRWDKAARGWNVPDTKLAEAASLLFPASQEEEAIRLATCAAERKAASASRGRRVCKSCGQRINYGVYCGKCEFGR